MNWLAEMNVRGRTVQFKLEIQQNSADGIEAKMVTPRGTNPLANFEVKYFFRAGDLTDFSIEKQEVNNNSG